ncbi:pectin acetylesterase-family hydrolase [Azohydromonas sediminis]|uniref:pectin acetylesterase-family hydrolase n=1 Tax=Azohydromonas sediminis TaxID=2259674 RepID=UPI0013C2BFBE|nr:pectin acetylesterase-family hydrolase [Azohydromonas sediminis]
MTAPLYRIARLGAPLLIALGLAAGVAHAKKPAPPDLGWQKIENPAPVTIGGKTYSATCSNYPGTDKTFSFWARKGTAKNTVVFFEGGGACWDNLTCSYPIAGLPANVPQFFVPQVAPGTDPATFDGIFRTDRADNPVRDWNMVYIPYCTGDLHAGSATKTYTSVGNSALGLPAGVPLTIEHRGFDNFMVVLDWMKKNLDRPKNLLVTGSSAGGYGASLNFPYLARAYPQAHLYVVADASQGVTTPAWDRFGRSSWNLQFAPGAFGPNPAALPSADLLRAAAQSHPRAKVAQFTTTFDEVQILFYGVMKQYYPPGGACPNPAIDWNQQMITKLVEYDDEVKNFRYYLAGGTYHTLMRSPLFYTEASTGTPFNEWLRQMLVNRGGTGGHGGRWTNEACPGCLATYPCPTP